jgi:hypothetical protein
MAEMRAMFQHRSVAARRSFELTSEMRSIHVGSGFCLILTKDDAVMRSRAPAHAFQIFPFQN